MADIGVAVAILQDNKILLVKHSYGQKKWSLPGGRLEFPESLETCAIRETKEETGLDVKAKRVVGVYALQKSPGVFVLFEADTIGGTLVQQTNETTNCEFFSEDDIPEDTYPAQKTFINDAFLGAEKTVWDFGKDRESQIN